MFVRNKVVKIKGKQYEYLQLVQNYRKNGKTRQRVLLTLGRTDQLDHSFVDQIVTALSDLTQNVQVLTSLDDLDFTKAKSYGDILVLQRLWKELGFNRFFSEFLSKHNIEFDVQAALKGMIFNRAIDAHSKLSTYEWLKKNVYFPEGEKLQVHHLYRAMDFLIKYKDKLENRLHNKLVNLLNYDTSVIFYDCSLVDMYGKSADLCQISRKKRTQYLVSLVLSRDGLPLGHEVHPGNTADIATVQQTIEKLKKRFSIGRCIFVCDRGMVSQEKLDQINALGYEYIVGVRLNQWKEIKDMVLTTRGRYRQIRPNLQVKEACVNGRRYIICQNPSRTRKDRYIREEVVESLEEEIKQLGPKTKEAARLYGHKYKGRFLKKLKDGTLKIDYAQIREDEKYDGKYILCTSDKNLSPEEIAITYKRLSEIERSFRSLKSLHDMEPTYHSVDRRIKAHVNICVLAHLLERILEKKLEKEGVILTASKALRYLKELQMARMTLKNRNVLVRGEITPEISRIFKALHYSFPSRVQFLS